MIICPKCDFEVSYKMRHSIELNSCPSCGKVLLNNIEIRRISSISSRLNSQEFSEKMGDSLISDVSFFIYFHIVKALSKDNGEQSNPVIKDSIDDSEGLDDDDDDELDLKAIRDEVETEVLIKEDAHPLDDDELEADRVSRLRSLARKQKMASKNPLKVKRISS